MANKNTKRLAKLARKERAARHWSALLVRNADKHKNTIRKSK